MVDTSGTQTTASYNSTNELAGILLRTLAEEEASIGYGMLACALTLCRLQNTGDERTDDEEIDFIQALMEWTGAYFAAPTGSKGN